MQSPSPQHSTKHITNRTGKSLLHQEADTTAACKSFMPATCCNAPGRTSSALDVVASELASSPFSPRSRWYLSTSVSRAWVMNWPTVSGMGLGSASSISGCGVMAIPASSSSVSTESRADRDCMAHSRMRIAFSSATSVRSSMNSCTLRCICYCTPSAGPSATWKAYPEELVHSMLSAGTVR